MPQRIGWRPSDALAVAALAAGVWLLYGGITRLWWTGDDLFHLHFVSTHSPLSYGFSSRTWSHFPTQMFLPLQLLSYSSDLTLFGLEPSGFYGHQLLSFVLAACAVYATLRVWLPPFSAWAAGGLIVLGIPFSSLVIELPCRHYIEGLIWAALAVLFFVKALRRNADPLWATLSALFYFLSILEKEIYVPLPVLLAVLPESTWRVRLRGLRPHVLALSLSAAWRWAMLGTIFGGYGWATRPRELPGLIAGLPVKLVATWITGPRVADLLLLGCVLAGMSFLVLRRPRSLPVLVACAIGTLLPIVPVAKAVGDRFGTLPWALAAIGFVFGCRALAAGSPTARRASTALLLLAISVALLVNRRDWARRYAESERASAEGRFFLTMSPGDLLRHPRIPPAAMKETRWLKEERLGLPRGSGWFADDIYLCRSAAPPGRVWEYDEPAKRIREVTARAVREASRSCAGLRPAPLWARFESSGGNLFWTLGPYERGTYALILERGIESFPVARDDGYRTTPGLLSLMVRYQSPAGWAAYSPELTMDFRVASRFHWERSESAPRSVPR